MQCVMVKNTQVAVGLQQTCYKVVLKTPSHLVASCCKSATNLLQDCSNMHCLFPACWQVRQLVNKISVVYVCLLMRCNTPTADLNCSNKAIVFVLLVSTLLISSCSRLAADLLDWNWITFRHCVRMDLHRYQSLRVEYYTVFLFS
jgi:hypothetical protein